MTHQLAWGLAAAAVACAIACALVALAMLLAAARQRDERATGCAIAAGATGLTWAVLAWLLLQLLT